MFRRFVYIRDNAQMDETYRRLEQALCHVVSKLRGTAVPKLTLEEVATLMSAKSAQTVSNWKARGIPQAKITLARERHGIDPLFLQTGQGDVFMASNLAVANASPLPARRIPSPQTLGVEQLVAALADALALLNEDDRDSAGTLLSALAKNPASPSKRSLLTTLLSSPKATAPAERASAAGK